MKDRNSFIWYSQPGVDDKLEEISDGARTNDMIPGYGIGFSTNECLPTENKIRNIKMKCQNAIESDHITIPEPTSLDGSLNAIGYSNSSPTSCQRITNVQNKVFCQRKQLQEQNHIVSEMQIRNFAVDPAVGGLGWETNNNPRSISSDKDRCIHKGMLVHLLIFTSKNGVHGAR